MSSLVYYGRSGKYTSICCMCGQSVATETLPAPSWVYVHSRTGSIVNSTFWPRLSADELYPLMPLCPQCVSRYLKQEE